MVMRACDTEITKTVLAALAVTIIIDSLHRMRYLLYCSLTGDISATISTDRCPVGSPEFCDSNISFVSEMSGRNQQCLQESTHL